MYNGTSFTLEDPVISPLFFKLSIASGLNDPSERSPSIALSTDLVASAIASSKVFSGSDFIIILAEFSTLVVYLGSDFMAAKPFASKDTAPP